MCTGSTSDRFQRKCNYIPLSNYPWNVVILRNILRFEVWTQWFHRLTRPNVEFIEVIYYGTLLINISHHERISFFFFFKHNSEEAFTFNCYSFRKLYKRMFLKLIWKIMLHCIGMQVTVRKCNIKWEKLKKEEFSTLLNCNWYYMETSVITINNLCAIVAVNVGAWYTRLIT